DAFVVDALVWVSGVADAASEADKALDLLVKDHIDSRKLATVCRTITNSGTNRVESLLRKILDKSPHKDVQGTACMSLAEYLKGKAELTKGSDQEKFNKEAEALFERVIRDFAEVKSLRRRLGESAKHELFEMRNLAIGKKAPEIAGEDIDGKKFGLSDYLGKVVVLDFWGNW